MTMHMHHAGLSMTNTRQRRTKLTPAQVKAQQEHEAWLKKQGLHTQQLAEKSQGKQPKKLKLDLVKDRQGPQCSNGFAPGGAKISVFDSQWQKTYDDDPLMAEREAEALKKAESLKTQIAPAYSKGAYQLITGKFDVKNLGRKI